MIENAITITGLNKVYRGDKKTADKHALRGVNLNIPTGSIFGLLGPNGAGKSTLINVLAGLVNKTSGTVKIWDTDIDENRRASKAAIGIVNQEINYDAFFTPKQLLDLVAGLYGVPKRERRTDELLDLVGLTDKADAYTRSLSGGMKRRLMIAKAMVHSPPMLVLDDPTAGVDVELRRMLWDNVRLLNKQGVTIVLTTHYLEEAEELCDEIAIINHGEIIAHESKEDLLGRIDNKEIRFRLTRAVDADLPPALMALNARKDGRRSVVIGYTPAQTKVGDMITAIQKAGYTIADIDTSDSDLEDVFVQLTG